MMCHGVMVAPVSVILDHYINLPTKLPFSSLKACTNAIPHFGTELDNILFKIHILYISKTTILGINLDILLLELHPLNLNKIPLVTKHLVQNIKLLLDITKMR